MTARDETSGGVGASGSAATVAEITAKTEACNLQSPDKSLQPIVLSPAGTLFSPAESLAWVLGLLAVGACIAPWLARGWLWLELIAAAMGLLACYDALALWRSRGEFAPVLLPAEKGLGGREGQTIQVPLALTGSGRRGPHSEVRAAIMPATEESETAMRVRGGPQLLKLEPPSLDGGSAPVNRAPILLWSLGAGRALGASARSQIVAALVGSVLGAIVCAPAYVLLVRAFTLGSPRLPAPTGIQWKAMGEVVAQGLSALPPGALPAVAAAAVIGVILAALGSVRWLPSAMAMGIGILVPVDYSMAFVLGAVIVRAVPALRERGPVAGAGLIAGDSLVGIAVALLMSFALL